MPSETRGLALPLAARAAGALDRLCFDTNLDQHSPAASASGWLYLGGRMTGVDVPKNSAIVHEMRTLRERIVEAQRTHTVAPILTHLYAAIVSAVSTNGTDLRL